MNVDPMQRLPVASRHDGSAQVFKLMGSKASRALGNEDADNQARWCAAVVERISARYR